MKVREPVARPLDVVAVELLLSASQAFVVGVLMYLAIGVWGDRGVGLGPVAIVLALLGLAVGGAWVYWLLGGAGWPLAAADVPVAVFLGFALVLGWTGDDLFRVAGVPLLLATLAAIYGIVGGVFIDSPRRWRWDQRQKLRPGTPVPRISDTTRKVVAAVPRSVPRRVEPPLPPSELATRIGTSTAPAPAAAGPRPEADIPYEHVDDASPEAPTRKDDKMDTMPADDVAAAARPTTSSSGPDARLGMPTQRLAGVETSQSVAAASDDDEGTSGSIELPASYEPKAQRSPWAWAAPPEWNRDEDDERAASRPSGRS